MIVRQLGLNWRAVVTEDRFIVAINLDTVERIEPLMLDGGKTFGVLIRFISDRPLACREIKIREDLL